MVDNSGLFIATEIKTMITKVLGEKNPDGALIRGEPEFEPLQDKVSVQLISFSHDAVALYKPGDEDSIAEAVAPLIAFDRIRMSRRVSYQALAEKSFETNHEVKLFDGAFNPPLSWTLAKATRKDIAKRAGGLEDDHANDGEKICCLIKPGPVRFFPPEGIYGRREW